MKRNAKKEPEREQALKDEVAPIIESEISIPKPTGKLVGVTVEAAVPVSDPLNLPYPTPSTANVLLRSEKMSRITQTLVKQYGEQSMIYLAEKPDYVKVHNWISTQNTAIDWMLSGKADGTGGLPVGRIVELFGDPSSGKSLLLTQLLSEVQNRGGIAVLYDPEATFDGYFANRVGMNVEQLMYTKGYKDSTRKKIVLDEHGKPTTAMIPVRLPATVEELKAQIEELIDITYHEYPDVLLGIGLDSVAALSTIHELNEPEKKDLTKASGIRSFVKMLEAKMADRNILFIATNHVIANIHIENKFQKKEFRRKMAPQEDKAAPGGSGLPFGSSVRLDLTRGRDIAQNKVLVIGHEIYVYSHKNKVYPAHKATVVDMYFGSGMDKYSGFLEILLAKEIIEDLGDQVYRYNGIRFKKLHQDKGPGRPGYRGLAEVIQENPEILTLANEV